MVDMPTLTEPQARDGLAGLADVAVHLDGSERDAAKLGYAEMLAGASQAHLTAFLTNPISLALLPPGPGKAWIMSELWKNGRALGAALEDEVKARMSQVEGPWTLRRFDNTLAELTLAAARLARTSNIVVFGRPYGEDRHWPELLEAVLIDSGGTALVVPPGFEPRAVPKSVVVGWRDTMECARAIAVALPFLKAAETVHLVSVAEGQSAEEQHREPAADMARHLARHGVRVEVRHLPLWHEPAMGLVNEAQALGAQLIVLGAYGRSRVREWIWGGVTRDLLTRSPIPLLLHH